MALVVWLHGRLFVLAAWILGQLGRLVWTLFIKIPVEAVTRLGTAVLAWLHIMVRLWVGVAVGGVLAFLAASILYRLSPAGSNWRLVALLVCLVWLVVFFSAGRFTMEWFSLRRVRQSQTFREVHQGVRRLEGEVGNLREGMARATERTPLGGAFRSNREKTARRVEEQEREDARVAEAMRRADEDERRLDDLAAMEIDPHTNEPVGGGR